MIFYEYVYVLRIHHPMAQHIEASSRMLRRRRRWMDHRNHSPPVRRERRARDVVDPSLGAGPMRSLGFLQTQYGFEINL